MLQYRSSSPANYWRDVGDLDSYFQANMDLLGPQPLFPMDLDPQWPVCSLRDSSVVRAGGSRISCRALIESSVIRRSVISHGACIERGASVEDSVILPGARVGRKARLRRTIVAEGASIPDGFSVELNASVDRSRFLVTPRGVVVVSASPRKTLQQFYQAVGVRYAVTMA